jgi:hypothetical protein
MSPWLSRLLLTNRDASRSLSSCDRRWRRNLQLRKTIPFKIPAVIILRPYFLQTRIPTRALRLNRRYSPALRIVERFREVVEGECCGWCERWVGWIRSWHCSERGSVPSHEASQGPFPFPARFAAKISILQYTMAERMRSLDWRVHAGLPAVEAQRVAGTRMLTIG